ncbi:MAG: M3 family metallopeptidase, partial [Candidatus Eiseniibacteriota bacterium]
MLPNRIALGSLALLLGVGIVTLAIPQSSFAQPQGVSWNWTPEQIHATGPRVMKEADQRYDKLVKQRSARTFENTVVAMENVGAWAGKEIGPALFLKYVSTDEKVRAASDSVEVKFSRWAIKTQAREDLYQALKQALANDPPKNDLDKRLAEKMTLDFELNGLSLPKEKREQVTALKQKISDLGIRFDTNLNEAQDSLLLTKADLAGMPDSYIERLDKAADGRYKVTVSYPDFYPFMQNSTNAAARKELEAKFSNRAADKNLPLLKEALGLRQELATTMGYKTYADYATVDRMAKNPTNVMTFLDGLVEKLKPYRDADIATLAAMKKEKEGDAAGPLAIYDWRFYDNEIKKTKYQIDPEQVRQYFPLDVVTNGLLTTYQKLFGLKFEEVKPAKAWHPDVQLFRVDNAADGKTIGWFYLDLFPRPNKYGHAAAWS